MKKKNLFVWILSIIVTLSLGVVSCSTTPKTSSEKNQQRDSIRSMADSTLLDLYKTEPAAKNAIEKAEGYAVISDFGFKMGIMGGVHGHGVAIHNTTQQETFLNMAELQPGLGVGAEKFHVVLLFESSEAFNKLVTSGWEFGADAMAVAKTKSAGGASSGAVTFSEDVKIYQLDEKGAIVGVSITGAKYYKDKDLN